MSSEARATELFWPKKQLDSTRIFFFIFTITLMLLMSGCGLGIRSKIWPPTATPLPSWVGKIEESATPISTFLAKIADVDERSGRPLTDLVALRESAGRGSTPTGFSVQPGERIFIVGVELRGNERFFKVRSFDGLKRGWLPESSLAPQDRPPK